MVMYSDPETFARVVGVRSAYTKGSFYSSVRLPPVEDNVFSTTDADEHKVLRAKLAGGVSKPSLPLPSFHRTEPSPQGPELLTNVKVLRPRTRRL